MIIWASENIIILTLLTKRAEATVWVLAGMPRAACTHPPRPRRPITPTQHPLLACVPPPLPPSIFFLFSRFAWSVLTFTFLMLFHVFFLLWLFSLPYFASLSPSFSLFSSFLPSLFFLFSSFSCSVFILTFLSFFSCIFSCAFSSYASFPCQTSPSLSPSFILLPHHQLFYILL